MSLRPFSRLALTLAVAVAALPFSARAMTPEERRAYREHLVATLPDVPAFDDWIKRTDELPPDFDALPRHNLLPEPMTFFGGHPVKTADEWAKRRSEILDLYQQYVWGKIPPHAAITSADVTDTPGKGDTGGDYLTRSVVLHCGPDGKGILHMTLILPAGKGPFPVIVGPGLIGGFFDLAPTLLRRGYIAASYAGSDFGDDSKAMAALYPDTQDLGALPRRAWAASTALDYVLSLPQVAKNQVAAYGYSRDGKQAAIAAALDTRFSALIAGSAGVGGLLAFRNAGERNQAESIQSTTLMFPDWFAPRLRFFVGREDRLPVDGNLLLAAIAPRPVFMVSGYNDEVSNDWGDEQSIHSAAAVYDFLKPATLTAFGGITRATRPGSDALAILRVPGFHGANDMDAALDFLDHQFGRSDRPTVTHWIFPWDYKAWAAKKPMPMDFDFRTAKPDVTSLEQWKNYSPSLLASVNTLLGEGPTVMIPPPAAMRPGRGRGAPATGPNPGQVAPDVPAWVIQRSLAGTQEFGWFVDEANATASQPLTFGSGVTGTLYYPKDTPAGTKLPTVIWLHSYSYPLGYMWVYKRDLHPILALVKAGYAVLAYDQAGFGSRMAEAAPFYDRYPNWSLMGHLVDDVHLAITALQKNTLVKPDSIYAFGYSMGGNVALYAAATDPRLKGIVSIAGFTPMRSDTEKTGTGGLARYSIERPLLPKLGWFIGKESALPYDDDDLLALCAPRPVLVVSPKYDRDANPADVRTAVSSAKKIYTLFNAPDNLAIQEPDDYNRLPPPVQDAAIAWMKEHMK